MQDKFYIEMPLKKEYFTTIRLTASGVCSLAGYDIDEIEDFKLCVNEACLLLLRNNYCKAYIEFSLGGNISATISGGDCTKNSSLKDEVSENFAYLMLKELVSEVEFIKQNDIIKQIKLVLDKKV